MDPKTRAKEYKPLLADSQETGERFCIVTEVIHDHVEKFIRKRSAMRIDVGGRSY